jgi:hypothetical protein
MWPKVASSLKSMLATIIPKWTTDDRLGRKSPLLIATTATSVMKLKI